MKSNMISLVHKDSRTLKRLNRSTINRQQKLDKREKGLKPFTPWSNWFCNKSFAVLPSTAKMANFVKLSTIMFDRVQLRIKPCRLNKASVA